MEKLLILMESLDELRTMEYWMMITVLDLMMLLVMMTMIVMV